MKQLLKLILIFKDGKAIGWIVGVIENQTNKYVFALKIEENRSDSPPKIQNDLHNKLSRILITLQLYH